MNSIDFKSGLLAKKTNTDEAQLKILEFAAGKFENTGCSKTDLAHVGGSFALLAQRAQ